MTANHPRDVLDSITELWKHVRDLQGSRARGAQPAICTSTMRPGNPTPGQPAYETDTGLNVSWNGSAWIYAPQLIYKTVLGASAASVRLPASGSIPQGFTNLRLVIAARSTGTGANGYDSATVAFNSASSGYNWSTIWVPQGGTVQTAGGTSQSAIQCLEIWNAHFGSAGRGIGIVDIPGYSDSTNIKTLISTSAASDGGAAGIQQIYSGTLSGTTAAITSLTVAMSAGSFTTGSAFSLYGT